MDDHQPHRGGMYLGTSSAPVSRNPSRENTLEYPSNGGNSDEPIQLSPRSSEATAVSNISNSGNGNGTGEGEGVRFANHGAPTSTATAHGGTTTPRIDLDHAHGIHSGGGGGIMRKHHLGTASAPSSPGLTATEFQHPDDHKMHNDENGFAVPLHPIENHHDPAVAAGLLPASAAEPDGIVPASASGGVLHSNEVRRTSSTPQTYGTTTHGQGQRYTPYFDPYGAQQGFNQTQRGSHQAHHSKPLYSLARPLPTKEQRDMQKSYREAVKARVGPDSRHSTPRSSPRPNAPMVGPGAHHAHWDPYSHHSSRNPSFLEPSYPAGHHPATQDNEQIMALLRQVLAEQKSGNKASDNDKDVREDDQDASLARKEGFGKQNGKGKGELADKTARAERQDDVSSSGYDSDEESEFPNPWARFRHAMREPFAEYLGTMLLVMFGTGVSLQYFLSLDPNVVDSPRGTYLSVSFGWGIGVGIGVWVAGGISGGHINPAVTLSLACFRGFPWKKVPGYMLAQVLGSMTGAGINYAMYRRAITIYEGGPNIRTVTGTANLFSTYPLDYMTDANCFLMEFCLTAILLITVLAISDSNNAAPPDGLNPLVLLFLIVGIGACFGMQTAYCINPARDLGPRLVTWFAGYGRDVWNFRNQYWLWTPVIATMSGGLMGCVIYDTLIYTGSESPLNMKWDWPWRNKKRSGFAPATKEKAPLGQTEP